MNIETSSLGTILSVYRNVNGNKMNFVTQVILKDGYNAHNTDSAS